MGIVASHFKKRDDPTNKTGRHTSERSLIVILTFCIAFAKPIIKMQTSLLVKPGDARTILK